MKDCVQQLGENENSTWRVRMRSTVDDLRARAKEIAKVKTRGDFDIQHYFHSEYAQGVKANAP